MTDRRHPRNDPTSESTAQRSGSRPSANATDAARPRSPEAVLSDPLLTNAEKLDILERWAQDQRQIAVAVQEGMPGPEPRLLRRTLEALWTLHAREGTEDRPESRTEPLSRPGSSPMDRPCGRATER